MAAKSRSPEICPWDPGEVCKVANGACLPPRKRLLAGLKQNGWLSSSTSYLQGGSGASCTTEELKMELDPGETKPECSADALSLESPISKQGECKAVVNLVSLKSKRATKRRKSLSVLSDCHKSVKNLQPELLKSSFGSGIGDKVRSNKGLRESLFVSKKGNETGPSYKEMAEAARAAAASTAKAAVEAKALALEKAAIAAKAAAIARSALEAVALADKDKVLKFNPSRHVGTSCQQNRMGEELKREHGSEPKVQLSHPILHIGSVNDFPKKKMGHRRTPIVRTTFNQIKEDEETEASKSSIMSFDISAILSEIKEDHMHCGSIISESVAVAGVGNPSHNHHEAEQAPSDKIGTASCPVPPPLDDEKLARQLHRAMNSSPRIARSQACLETSRKRETPPSSTEACTHARYGQVGGSISVKEKQKNYRNKLQVLRSNGRADVKVKSMSAINETLNMLQNATVTSKCVYERATTSYAANYEKYAKASSHKDDNSMANVSSHEAGGISIGNCDVDDGKAVLKAECDSAHVGSHAYHGATLERSNESRAIKSSQTKNKFKKQMTGSISVSSQNWDGSRACELPPLRAENRSDAQSQVATSHEGSDLETTDDEDDSSSYDNEVKLIGSGPGLVAGLQSIEESHINRMIAIDKCQENFFCNKSSRATRKISDLSLCGERKKRGEKVLGALANGLSEGNQNLRRSLSSYIPSPTIS